MIEKLKNKILEGEKISKDEALRLIDMPLNELTEAADKIRTHFCGKKFDVCSIINAKSGKCSENCKFCAQSSFYKTHAEEFAFLQTDEIVKAAKESEKQGVTRFSIVTSGRKPNKDELLKIATAISEIKKHCEIKVCASLGLLNFEELKMLKNAGLTRFHNNLESSENFFPNICTTHSTKDKIKSLKCALEAGLEICSGGIIGLGESFEDRIDMAILLSEIGAKSIPINFLNAIKGTPFGENPPVTEDEALRTCAIFRFLNPKAFIRLAGGRNLFADKGAKCLKSGVNAVITGDMLTTTGTTVKSDMKLIDTLKFEVNCE